MKPFINGQKTNPDICRLRYGLLNIADNGCELIAVYNALILAGHPVAFDQIIKIASHTRGIRWLWGLWGTKPKGIGKLLLLLDQPYRKIKRTNTVVSQGIYILSFWNRPRQPFAGIHTVAFSCDEAQNITVYNFYSTKNVPKIFHASKAKSGMAHLLSQTGRPIVLYRLSPPNPHKPRLAACCFPRWGKRGQSRALPQ